MKNSVNMRDALVEGTLFERSATAIVNGVKGRVKVSFTFEVEEDQLLDFVGETSRSEGGKDPFQELYETMASLLTSWEERPNGLSKSQSRTDVEVPFEDEAEYHGVRLASQIAYLTNSPVDHVITRTGNTYTVKSGVLTVTSPAELRSFSVKTIEEALDKQNLMGDVVLTIGVVPSVQIQGTGPLAEALISSWQSVPEDLIAMLQKITRSTSFRKRTLRYTKASTPETTKILEKFPSLGHSEGFWRNELEGRFEKVIQEAAEANLSEEELQEMVNKMESLKNLPEGEAPPLLTEYLEIWMKLLPNAESEAFFRKTLKEGN